MAQQEQQTCLIQPPSGEGPPVVAYTYPIPEIKKPSEVLLRVSAVALNPTDYKIPEFHPAPAAIMGCDFMGTVVAAGSAVEEERGIGARLCGSVHGSNPENITSGAFAQYIVADSRLLVQVPGTWSDLEGAALGGIGWATVALAMEDSLGLTGLPSRPEPERPDGSRVPVLVYGGATATGTIACQILASAGYEPIATVSNTSAPLVKKRGASMTVPYTSADCAEVIRRHTGGRLKHAIDCITSPESVRCCFAAMARAGGRYASLEYAPEEWRTRKTIQVDMPIAYVITGKEVKLRGAYHRDADPGKFELADLVDIEPYLVSSVGRLGDAASMIINWWLIPGWQEKMGPIKHVEDGGASQYEDPSEG